MTSLTMKQENYTESSKIVATVNVPNTFRQIVSN